MLTTRALWLSLFALLAACNGSTGGADVVTADVPPSTPAMGGGVCCTPNLRTGCSPGFGLPGGWARSAAECPTGGGGFDGCPFYSRVDEHGCTQIVSGGCSEESYCGRAPTPSPDVVVPDVVDTDAANGDANADATDAPQGDANDDVPASDR